MASTDILIFMVAIKSHWYYHVQSGVTEIAAKWRDTHINLLL